MTRSINEIAQELNASGLTQHQLSLLVELLAAKATPIRKKRASPLIALPKDWKPTQEHYDWAEERGCPASWVLKIAEDMRNWARFRDERRESWNGTFGTFMRKALEPKVVHQIHSGHKATLGGGFA